MRLLGSLLAVVLAVIGCNQLLDLESPPSGLGERQVGGTVVQRAISNPPDAPSPPLPGATLEVLVEGEVIGTSVSDSAGKYLLDFEPGGPIDVVLRGTKTGFLDTVVFLPDPVAAPTTISFQLYEAAVVAKLAEAAEVPHNTAVDRYALISLTSAIGAVPNATINSTSGTVRYTNAATNIVLTQTSTSTSSTGLLFGVKTQAVTLTIRTADGRTFDREIDFGDARTALVRIRIP